MNIPTANAFVPDNINRIINQKGLKQCAVAEKIGLGVQMFNDMLNGRRLIKVRDIIALSEALEVPVAELFIHTGSHTA